MNTELAQIEVLDLTLIKPPMTEKRQKELLTLLEAKKEVHKSTGHPWYLALELAHQELENEIDVLEYSEFNNLLDDGILVATT